MTTTEVAAPARRLGVVAADLHRLAERLWAPADLPDWPVRVTTGTLPDTHRVVEEYAVAPGLDRPRYLLPLHHPHAVAAALTGGAQTQGRRTRLAARAGALGWRSGVLRRAVRGRLTVGVDRRIGDDELGEWLLLRRIAEQLGVPDLSAVVPVRRAMPNAKPTGRLMTHDGATVGYLKAGWSEATRALVANETSALRDLHGRVGRFAVPTVAATDRWHHLEYLVADPLPSGLLPLRGRPEPMAKDLLAIARTGDRSREPLARSSYLRSLSQRLEAAAQAVPDAVTVLRARLDAAVATAGADDVELGRWHGDWVSWNLAIAPSGPVAWDWEYSAACVPVGFDLLHWHFQETLARRDGTLRAAVDAVDAAAPSLEVLHVVPSMREVVASLYVVEILTRAAELAARGSGWNPRLHPALLQL